MKASNINFKKFLVLFAIVAIGAASVFVFLNRTSAAGFSGAIFTTVNDGAGVNVNLFDNDYEVYLNGGPLGGGPALPNGTYYFQVTTPNGDLLSTDPARCRQLLVAGGKVAGATGPCPHANGITSPNGSMPVQMVPFNPTTNSGGEYKVWLIRQATNTTIVGDPLTSAVLDFSNSNAKTDNFKIRTAPCENCDPSSVLSGTKFYDADADAVFDNGEVPVAGVQIEVTVTDTTGTIVTVVTTDAMGNWSLIVPTGADYSVREILPETCENGTYWVQTAPVEDGEGFQGYTGTANGNVGSLNFGDICFHPASGGLTLGYWSNKNGQRTMQTGAVDTSVPPVFVAPTTNPNCNSDGTSEGCDMAFLGRLNLKGEAMDRRAIVTVDFNPTNHANFKTWVLNANAYNMSYMLSGQLAATSLDVRHSYLDDDTLVDARGVCNAVGSCLGIITIGEVRMLANQSLGSAGGNTTISGDPLRDSQELMKTFLDRVNNNLLPFASAEPCGVCYPPPPTPTPEPLP